MNIFIGLKYGFSFATDTKGLQLMRRFSTEATLRSKWGFHPRFTNEQIITFEKIINNAKNSQGEKAKELFSSIVDESPPLEVWKKMTLVYMQENNPFGIINLVEQFMKQKKGTTRDLLPSELLPFLISALAKSNCSSAITYYEDSINRGVYPRHNVYSDLFSFYARSKNHLAIMRLILDMEKGQVVINNSLIETLLHSLPSNNHDAVYQLLRHQPYAENFDTSLVLATSILLYKNRKEASYLAKTITIFCHHHNVIPAVVIRTIINKIKRQPTMLQSFFDHLKLLTWITPDTIADVMTYFRQVDHAILKQLYLVAVDLFKIHQIPNDDDPTNPIRDALFRIVHILVTSLLNAKEVKSAFQIYESVLNNEIAAPSMILFTEMLRAVPPSTQDELVPKWIEMVDNTRLRLHSGKEIAAVMKEPRFEQYHDTFEWLINRDRGRRGKFKPWFNR